MARPINESWTAEETAAFLADLRQHLAYDPETGLFQWLRRVSARCANGWFRGTVCAHGYTHIRFRGRRYKAHRLAWLLTHGTWPPAELDHIDLDKLNNRVTNLRPATSRQNKTNRAARGRSERLGVGWDAAKGKWVVGIAEPRPSGTGSGRNRHLGYYTCETLGALAYDEAARIVHGQYANLNFPDVTARVLKPRTRAALIEAVKAIKRAELERLEAETATAGVAA